jgi:hypothetical protein
MTRPALLPGTLGRAQGRAEADSLGHQAELTASNSVTFLCIKG